MKSFKQIRDVSGMDKNKSISYSNVKDPWGRPKFVNGVCRLCGFDEDGRRNHKLNHQSKHPVLNFNSLCDSWTSVMECPFLCAPIWAAF